MGGGGGGGEVDGLLLVVVVVWRRDFAALPAPPPPPRTFRALPRETLACPTCPAISTAPPMNRAAHSGNWANTPRKAWAEITWRSQGVEARAEAERGTPSSTPSSPKVCPSVSSPRVYSGAVEGMGMVYVTPPVCSAWRREAGTSSGGGAGGRRGWWWMPPSPPPPPPLGMEDKAEVFAATRWVWEDTSRSKR